MWSICRTSLMPQFKEARPVRLVFAHSERSFSPSASMNLSDRSLSTVLKEDSSWFVSVMRSRWPLRHTRLCTRVQLPTVCARLWWLSRARTRCPKTSLISRLPAKSTIRISRACRSRLKKSSRRMRRRVSVKRRPTKIKLNTSMTLTLTTRMSSRLS